MKHLKIALFLMIAGCSTGCSFFYNILIINESDAPLEVHYKMNDTGSFDAPLFRSLADWETEKSIRRFWTESKFWENLPETEYHTNLQTRERVIKIAPRQVSQIEIGSYHSGGENFEKLAGITELKLVSSNGEIAYKGKLIGSQFEKDGYTFSKTFKDEIKDGNTK